jgi:hypothetical protein
MDLTQLVTYRFSPPLNRGEMRAILEYLDEETDLKWVGGDSLLNEPPAGDETYSLSVDRDGCRHHNNGYDWNAESADDDMRTDKIVDGRDFFGLNDTEQMDKFFLEGDSDWDFMGDVVPRPEDGRWTSVVLKSILEDHYILFTTVGETYKVSHIDDGICDGGMSDSNPNKCCISWENDSLSILYSFSDVVKFFNDYRNKSDSAWIVDEIVPKNQPLKENNEDPDWAWMSEIPEVVLGSDFTEFDICSEDNQSCKITLSDDGTSITFNYGYGDFIDTFYGGNDDWVFDVLIKHDGEYEDGGDGYNYESDEMNYIGGWLSDVDKELFEEILNKPEVIQLLGDKVGNYDPKQTEIKFGWQHRNPNKYTNDGLHYIWGVYSKKGKIDISYIDDDQQFNSLQYICDLIYKGRWDWDDFESSSLSDLSHYLEINRWRSINSVYKQTLKENKLDVEYSGGYGYRSNDEVDMTIPYPFKGEHNLTDIKWKIESIFDEGWSDMFYEEYSHEGAGEDINFAFKQMLEKLSEAVEELEEENALYESVFGTSPDIERELLARSEKDREEKLNNTETDPSKGTIKPSRTVMDNVCSRQKICDEQGPITFGQLRGIITSAQNKSLGLDVGGGIFKSFIRLLPFFLPQIALGAAVGSSIRAINKIIKPTIEGTRGYKRWWGKMIMSVMNLAEGELNTEDPLSKVFFISDGLLDMMSRKYQLKFARYISELADSKPDNEMVPEYFVENELRRWINEKFLLDPPLKSKF